MARGDESNQRMGGGRETEAIGLAVAIAQS
jgi:hypothetical protein